MNDATLNTYSNARLDDISRRVFFKAVTKAEELLDGKDKDGTAVPFSSERVHALAALMDASAVGFRDEEDETI